MTGSVITSGNVSPLLGLVGDSNPVSVVAIALFASNGGVCTSQSFIFRDDSGCGSVANCDSS